MSPHVRTFVCGAIALAAISSATHANAQSAQDKAAADVLFQGGKKLMLDGKYGEACPKFEESNRLDSGIGTMLWLADCYERNGQSASAWAQFDEAAETAARKKDPREKIARGRAVKLEATLVRLVVDVAPEAEVEGLEVRRDGSLLGKPLWGTAVPVDPGTHVVTASAPKKKSKEVQIQIASARSTTVLVASLEDEVKPAPIVVRRPPPHPSPPDGNTQRIIGLVVAGVGVVGVSVGTYFGLSAKSKLDDSNADNHCHDGNHCDAFGVQARSDSKSAATASTFSLIAGGAALAGGAAIYFTAPKSSAAALRVVPSVGRTGAELALMGAF